MHRIARLTALAIAIAAASACTGTAATPASPVATPTPAPIVTPAPTATPEPIATPEVTPEPEEVFEEEPEPEVTVIAKGKTFRTGTDWDIAVSGKVNFNAWKVNKAENMFNDKPPKGWVEVNIPIKAKYRGTGRATLDPAAHLLVLGADSATEYSMFEDNSCGVIPKDIFINDKTVRKGGKVAGNVCFRVPKADAKSLVLLWSDDTYGLDGIFTILNLR